MRSRLVLAVLSCCFLAFIPAEAKTKTKHVASKANAVDGDYVSALAIANRFLSSWQARDQEAGLLLFSDEAKHRTSEERLDDLFSAWAPVAYEIARGRKLKDGRYSFPVALFTSQPKRARPRFSEIVVVRTGKDDWAVDTLP